MGKVFVVGLGESSMVPGYIVQGNYFHLTPWFLSLMFAEECPGDFLDIHTSKAFNSRGDKDCRHRSVEGLILFSPPGDNTNMSTTTDRIPERYTIAGPNTGYTQDMTSFAVSLAYPGRIEREWFCRQTTLFLDAHSGRPQNRLRNFSRRMVFWVDSILEDYNGTCFDDTYEYEFTQLSGKDWDYTVKTTSVLTRHPKDEGVLNGAPCPFSREVGTEHHSYRIQARYDKRIRTMRYTYVEDDESFIAELTYTMPVVGMDIPWYYSKDGILGKVSRFAKALAKKPMDVLVSLTKPSNLPLATKRRLIKSALDDVRSLRINSIAYLQDLARLKDLWLPIKKLKRQPWKLKNWTNLWLTYRYGIRLFMLDTMEIMKAVEEQAGKPSDLTHIRSVWRTTPTTPLDNDVEVITHCKVLFDFKDSNIPLKVTQCLRKWDLILSRENIWDFIPYSFVLDWVLPVGEYLADLDAESDLTLYKSDTAIFSQKASYLLEGSLDHMLDIAEYNDGDGEFWLEPIWGGVSLSLKISSYNRWHENPRYATSQLEFSNGLNLIRTVDAVALTVQRKK